MMQTNRSRRWSTDPVAKAYFRTIIGVVVPAIVAVIWLTQGSVAQGPPLVLPSPADRPANAPGGDPLTARGRELEAQLIQLERTRSNLGAKHPLLADVNQQIEAIKTELAQWRSTPAVEGGLDPSVSLQERVDRAKDKFADQLDNELLDLIAVMALRIQRLEERVAELESTK